jgi:hypothetical protein
MFQVALYYIILHSLIKQRQLQILIFLVQNYLILIFRNAF